jgi:hypothetical protein
MVGSAGPHFEKRTATLGATNLWRNWEFKRSSRQLPACLKTPVLQTCSRITSLRDLIGLPSIALSQTNERPPSHEAMEDILHSGPTARRLRAKDGSGGGSCAHGGRAYEARLNLILPAVKIYELGFSSCVQKCRFANTWPEPLLRYLSKC